MDFLNKKVIYKDKNATVTKLTDVLTGDFYYIVFSNLLGDFKSNLVREIQGLEEDDAVRFIKNKIKNL